MNFGEKQLAPVTTRAGYADKHIYEILSDRLLALQRMLINCGFRAPIDRIESHLDVLKQLRGGGRIHSDEVLWSLVEATEFD